MIRRVFRKMGWDGCRILLESLQLVRARRLLWVGLKRKNRVTVLLALGRGACLVTPLWLADGSDPNISLTHFEGGAWLTPLDYAVLGFPEAVPDLVGAARGVPECSALRSLVLAVEAGCLESLGRLLASGACSLAEIECAWKRGFATLGFNSLHAHEPPDSLERTLSRLAQENVAHLVWEGRSGFHRSVCARSEVLVRRLEGLGVSPWVLDESGQAACEAVSGWAWGELWRAALWNDRRLSSVLPTAARPARTRL